MTTRIPFPALPTDHRALLRSRRADPTRIGAVAPTGRRAAAAMARSIPDGGQAVVLELGAGTGAITRALLARSRRVIALESDPELVERLRAAVPGASAVCADARDLEHVLDDAGAHRVEAVVSTLPLTLMAAGTRRAILTAAARRLTADGAFVTLTYRARRSAPAGELDADMAAVFTRVTWTGPVWRNLPPARLVHGRGPRPC